MRSMSHFDLTLIRKKLAKDMGKSAGRSASPSKGHFDVPLRRGVWLRYLKFAGAGIGIVFAVGFVSFLLEPRQGNEVGANASGEVSDSTIGSRKLPLDRLASLPPTPAVSAPIQEESSTRSEPPVDVKGVEQSGYYVQIAAYRGMRYLEAAREEISRLGFDRNMVVKETFWTPRFIWVTGDEGNPHPTLDEVTSALSGASTPILAESTPEDSVRLGPIYYTELVTRTQARLVEAGLGVGRIEVGEQELIHLLLLGPFESEALAEETRTRLKSYAPDAFVLWEKG